MQKDAFLYPDGAFALNVSSWEEIIRRSFRRHPHQSPFLRLRANGWPAPFQILIPQTFNFTVFEMSKKRTGENERRIKRRQWQTLINGKQKEGNYPCGKANCCTRAACTESDNPSVSSLCVKQNFYLSFEGERQLPHGQWQQPAAKESRKPQTETGIKNARQLIRSTVERRGNVCRAGP